MELKVNWAFFQSLTAILGNFFPHLIFRLDVHNFIFHIWKSDYRVQIIYGAGVKRHLFICQQPDSLLTQNFVIMTLRFTRFYVSAKNCNSNWLERYISSNNFRSSKRVKLDFFGSNYFLESFYLFIYRISTYCIVT